MALLLSIPARADVAQDKQLWINGTAMGPIYKRLLYYVEIQNRSSGDFAEARNQLFIRPMVGVQIHERFAMHLGYALVLNRAVVGEDPLENRFFVQTLWRMFDLGPVQFSNRSRFEYRWRSDGDDEAWRVRSMLRICAPLFGGERKWVRPLIYGEIFAHLNDADWGPHRGFDQMRSFGGFEIPLFDTSTLELGYLNQYINLPGPNVMNHVLSVTLLVRT